MSLYSKGSKAFFWITLNQIGVQLVNLVSVIVITRLLSPEELGLIASIAILIAVGNILITSGLSQSILRNPKSTEKDFSALFTFSLILSLALYLCLYLSAPFFAKLYSSIELTAIIRVYGLIFILSALSISHITKLSHNLIFRTQTIVTVSSSLISATCGIILALIDFGIWSIIYSALINAGIIAITYWIIVDWKPKFLLSSNLIKPHWIFGYKLIIAGIIDALLTNLSSAVIGKKFSIENAGLFYRAETLKQVPLSNIGLIINKIAYPILSRIETGDSFDDAFKRIFDLIVLVTFPTLIFISISSEFIVTILFSEKWIDSAKYLELLCFSGFLYPIHQLNITILNIKGFSDLFLKIQMYKSAIFLIIFSISIQWGITAMIYGLIIDTIFAFIINSYVLSRFSSFGFKNQSIRLKLPLTFLIVIMSIGSILKKEVLSISSEYNHLFILFIFSFLSYIILQLIFSKKVIVESIMIIKAIKSN